MIIPSIWWFLPIENFSQKPTDLIRWNSSARWASEAPHWDNDRGCWVDRAKKVEVVDDEEDLVTWADGKFLGDGKKHRKEYIYHIDIYWLH